MSDIDSITPVEVTGEERRHPAIRTLARACIALAKLRIAAAATSGDTATVEEAVSTPGAVNENGEDQDG